MTEKNKNPRTRVGVAPLFAIAGLAAPGAAASFGSSSLQQTLLVLGSATLIGSVLLLLYRWRPIRLGIHALLLCLPIELFYRLSYGGAISPGILSSIFETDSREAFELLAGHATLTLALIALTATAVYAAYASWTAEVPFSAAKCALAGCMACAMIGGSLGIAYRHAGSRADLPGVFKEGIRDSFPFDIANSLKSIALYRMDLRRTAALRAKFSFPGVRLLDAPQRNGEREVYVIVVGESSRRPEWSLYGYARQTTPLLDAISRDLIVFDDVTSNATLTILSVPMALTRATPRSFDITYSETSILSLLRQAGYGVYWISNQERFGRNEVQVSIIASAANRASFGEETHPRNDTDPYDSNLLPRLADVLHRTKSGKIVVFLHMMGSHYDYRDRYPTAFDSFRGADGLHRRLSDWQMPLVNAYDNSVRLTDYVLRQVIGQLAACDCRAAMVYFSDHGERLFDGGPADRDAGHGYPTIAPYEIEIPFLMYLSPRYRAENPQLVAQLRANAHRPAELDSLFETIVDLAGVTYDGRNASRSLFSPNYTPPRTLEVLNEWEKPLSFPLDFTERASPQRQEPVARQ